MQYLLQDLIKLPLHERLLIVEKLLCTMVQNGEIENGLSSPLNINVSLNNQLS